LQAIARQEEVNTPILMLTAKGQEIDKVVVGWIWERMIT